MSFTTTKLAGNRVLVKGTDFTGTEGQTVVFSDEWDHVNALRNHADAHSEFDAAVEEFFAPLTDAIKQLEDTAKVQINTDPAFYVTIQEGVDATPGQPEEVVQLNRDSVILRLLEQDLNTDRLIWVNDQLEIVAADATASTPVDAGDQA